MVNRTSLTVVQLNDSHAYFDLHQEMFWQGGQAVYPPAGGYARIATIVKQIRAAKVLRRLMWNSPTTISLGNPPAGGLPCLPNKYSPWVLVSRHLGKLGSSTLDVEIRTLF